MSSSWFMSFGQGLECRNWYWIPNICYCYLFQLWWSFTIWDIFKGHSHKGALTQKRSFLVICTTFRSDFHVGWKNQNKHSTLNLSFDTLSKWHFIDFQRFYGRKIEVRTCGALLHTSAPKNWCTHTTALKFLWFFRLKCLPNVYKVQTDVFW